jgi:hypothetical protein
MEKNYMSLMIYTPHPIEGVSKRALQLWKLIEIYKEDIHNVLNCQNVAKHRVLPRTVIRNCFDLFFRFLLHGKKEVEMELDSAAI